MSVARIESAGSELELVATAEGRKLTIYLDKLDTNESADGATANIISLIVSAALANVTSAGRCISFPGPVVCVLLSVADARER